MTSLIAAALAFLAIHLAVSGTRLRDAIVSGIGEGPYRGLFSLASIATIVWLCIAFNRATAGHDVPLFDSGHFRDMGVVMIFLAFALAVPGVARRSPTSVGGESTTQVDGVLRITRHPFLWGVMLWSAFHLIANGTLGTAIFFGTFFLVAAIGTRAIDGKMRRNRPAQWRAVAASTSNIPFAAIAAGRNKFAVREYFNWRLGLAVVLFAGFLVFHERLFSVSPFPA